MTAKETSAPKRSTAGAKAQVRKPGKRKTQNATSKPGTATGAETAAKEINLATAIEGLKETQPSLLSVKELANLLHINEKKVYQLAALGDIPCTKVTGKWLFPTQLVMDWIEQNSHGGALEDRLVLSGADDLLLDRVCRRLSLDLGRSASMSYNPSGSMHGLRLLAARRTDACFFHWGSSQANDRRHFGLLRNFREHTQWVTVRCFYRTEGLALSTEAANSLSSLQGETENSSLATLRALAKRKLRWAQRHHESGTQRLLSDLCEQCDLDMDNLGKQANYYAGERETATAILHDQADIALTSEAVAREYSLTFVRLDTIAIDLVLSRKTFFHPIVQQLLKQLLHTSDSVQKQWTTSYQLPENHDVQIVKK